VEWAPDEWRLELVARRDGQVVGTQGVHASHFGVTREVDTGSWVGRKFQAQGIGTAMRRAVLHLAFAGLGAETARSGAFFDNSPSLAVSEKLGYGPDGTATYARRGKGAEMLRLLLRRGDWQRIAAVGPPVRMDGLEPCLPLLGVAPDRPH
jgi:RimJ/RimL family protein N-acetyltransferase